MTFYSPLRYPGGKRKLARYVASVCENNSIKGHYVEPYAGGAGVALHLLLEGHVSRITINDKDRAIYAFWYSVLHETEKLCQLISSTRVSVRNWRKQKEVQKNKNGASLLSLGFSTFFLNRTNVSGILDGGPIGGLDQSGAYKIDCRFNKKELIRRIRLIASKKSSIRAFQLDALDLVRATQKTRRPESTIVYFDPPYYVKGESLYMNHYRDKDHKAVSRVIKKIRNIQWIVSYDNVPEVRSMYSGFRKKEYQLLHTARDARVGREILFFSNRLVLPRVTDPTSL